MFFSQNAVLNAIVDLKKVHPFSELLSLYAKKTIFLSELAHNLL